MTTTDQTNFNVFDVEALRDAAAAIRCRIGGCRALYDSRTIANAYTIDVDVDDETILFNIDEKRQRTSAWKSVPMGVFTFKVMLVNHTEVFQQSKRRPGLWDYDAIAAMLQRIAQHTKEVRFRTATRDENRELIPELFGVDRDELARRRNATGFEFGPSNDRSRPVTLYTTRDVNLTAEQAKKLFDFLHTEVFAASDAPR